jgi:mRNA interferase MazF
LGKKYGEAGEIVKLGFVPQSDPQSGRESAGYRPAVAISDDFFNTKTNLTIVCPITNTKRPFPLHVELDSRTETTGTILREQIKALDLSARTPRFV